jgi:hypothetical protein
VSPGIAGAAVANEPKGDVTARARQAGEEPLRRPRLGRTGGGRSRRAAPPRTARSGACRNQSGPALERQGVDEAHSLEETGSQTRVLQHTRYRPSSVRLGRGEEAWPGLGLAPCKHKKYRGEGPPAGRRRAPAAGARSSRSKRLASRGTSGTVPLSGRRCCSSSDRLETVISKLTGRRTVVLAFFRRHLTPSADGSADGRFRHTDAKSAALVTP